MNQGWFQIKEVETNDEKLLAMTQSREEETFRSEKTEHENDMSYEKNTLGFDGNA